MARCMCLRCALVTSCLSSPAWTAGADAHVYCPLACTACHHPQRTKALEPQDGDLSAYDGIFLRVKGDGQIFKVCYDWGLGSVGRSI